MRCLSQKPLFKIFQMTFLIWSSSRNTAYRFTRLTGGMRRAQQKVSLRWGYLQRSSDWFVSLVFRSEYTDPMNSHHYLGVSCCPHPTSNPSAHLGGSGQDDRSPGILGLLQARQRARELGTLALYILSRSSWHASSIIHLSIWLVALNLGSFNIRNPYINTVGKNEEHNTGALI